MNEDCVYKQRCNANQLSPELDENGSSTNGWAVYNYNNKEIGEDHCVGKWRYATMDEAIHYDKVLKPFNINEYRISLVETIIENLDKIELKLKS